MEKNNKKSHQINKRKQIPRDSINTFILNKKIEDLVEHQKLSITLSKLCITHIDLTEVPQQVITLCNLKSLDVSFNNIEYFDDVPEFCHSIECLNISNNNLLGPPYWIWSESPANLKEVDLSYNRNITNSFVDGYFEEFLQYKTLVKHIKINNCRIIKHVQLLGTLCKAKHVEIGSTELNKLSDINKLEEVPCGGLENCCDIEQINLSNTYIYCVKESIQNFKNLRELNLSQNKLTCLLNEICYIHKLEVCILSINRIMYLPEKFAQLKQLVTLSLDSNELCMLPEDICKLHYLKRLDLYDNKLYDLPNGVEDILEIDLAQNYFDEPQDEHYINKRKIIRNIAINRLNGCKEEKVPESLESDILSDEEVFSNDENDCDNANRTLSSPEDWDSDEYWVPHRSLTRTEPWKSPWIYFVERKLAEGCFCPFDAHEVSIYEKVKYEKACQPQIEYESDGQFDDIPEDESSDMLTLPLTNEKIKIK